MPSIESLGIPQNEVTIPSFLRIFSPFGGELLCMSADVMVQPLANEVDLIGWQSLAFVHDIPNLIGYVCWYELEIQALW